MARIMYQEGWGYAFAFISIVILSIIIFSHDLGEIDLQGDEYLMVSASEGYLRTGTFYQWDYLNNTLSDTLYDRAWPHTWMIARSYKLFGISEFCVTDHFRDTEFLVQFKSFFNGFYLI